MPTTWVEPKVFLRHKDVTIYRIYRHDDADEGLHLYLFGWDELCSEAGERFDVRQLPNPRRLDLTSSRNRRRVIKGAIDAGLVTADGLNLPGEALNADDLLRELVDWDSVMGGWDAPCWRRVRRYLELLRTSQADPHKVPGKPSRSRNVTCAQDGDLGDLGHLPAEPAQAARHDEGSAGRPQDDDTNHAGEASKVPNVPEPIASHNNSGPSGWGHRADQRYPHVPKALEAAHAILSRICAHLFWELTPGGRWMLNPNKTWSPDILDEIARTVRPPCRGCDGAGIVLPSGDICDECDGSGLAPEDWKEREDYA